VLIYWNNYLTGRSFQINQVSLNLLGTALGSEAWMQNYLSATETIDHSVTTSVTSPVCLEGQSNNPELISISGSPQVQHGAGNRWFANLPLQTTGITNYQVSFQNGGLIEPGTAQWLPTELFSSPNLTIRQGDSLLLVVQPPGGVTGPAQITIGQTVLPATIGTAQPYQFTQSGTFTVTGTVPSTPALQKSIQVTVVASSFNGSPVAWVGRTLNWSNPLLLPPPQVVLDVDNRVTYQETKLSSGGNQVSLLVDAPDPRYLVARLGADGPILANAEIQGINVASSVDTGVFVIQTYTDGSELVEMPVVVTDVFPGIQVVISIFAGGVTFDDGTTVKTLTAADFNSLGVAMVKFIYPAGAKTSVCHTLKVYNGTTLVGSR
jgi:hypothetical protein